MLFLLANECPEDKYLNKFVVEKVCGACANIPEIWRQLGIALMEQESVTTLDVIKVNNSGNVTLCCSTMFNLWRQRQPKANWNQLIRALKEVKLNTLADEIEKLLSPSVEQQHIEHVQNMQQLDKGMYCICITLKKLQMLTALQLLSKFFMLQLLTKLPIISVC